MAVTDADTAPTPTEFSIDTRIEWACPEPRPVTVADVVPAPAWNESHVVPPSPEISTCTAVMAEPPFDGVTHERVRRPLPTMTERPVGTSGTVAGTASTSTQVLVPMAVTAATRNRYGVPLASPATTAPTSAEVPSSTIDQLAPSSTDVATT